MLKIWAENAAEKGAIFKYTFQNRVICLSANHFADPVNPHKKYRRRENLTFRLRRLARNGFIGVKDVPEPRSGCPNLLYN
jgi:hypothetical protein